MTKSCLKHDQIQVGMGNAVGGLPMVPKAWSELFDMFDAGRWVLRCILNISQQYTQHNHIRDFTYVEDIAEGIKKIVLSKKKTKEKYNIFNIGNDKPIHLIEYINQIEKCLDKKAKKINLPLQQGDIVKTHASIKKIKN